MNQEIAIPGIARNPLKATKAAKSTSASVNVWQGAKRGEQTPTRSALPLIPPPSSSTMTISRIYRPEELRSDEIVEILYELLRESRESLPHDAGPGPGPIAPAPTAGADLLSPAPGVSNGHDQ